MTKTKSPEFLTEIWSQAKAHLPGWLYASLLQSSRSRAGGLAAHRIDEPDAISKLALTEIKPSKLREVSDEDLGAVWLRLNQWYVNAKRRKQAVENFVNAGLWTKVELEKRGKNIDLETSFVKEIEELENLNKERKNSISGIRGKLPAFIESRLDKMPAEILLVRDFVSIAGSAAVAEKPNDVDVVIRAEYDTGRQGYLIDSRVLGIALRRFLSPDKKGPQAQLLGSPQGSFTDYIPMFDLVARKREPNVVKIEPVPSEYKGQERVVKAERNTLTVGSFFTQPKPTRPAQEKERMSVEGLVALYKKNSDWLPAFVQKKFDGANHQIHKDGSKVIIYSEDGDDNTDRLPRLVKAVQALKFDKMVLPAELEYWKGKQHFPREKVAGYLAQRDKPDDSNIVANLYDVLWADEDLHELAFEKRLKILSQLGSGTMEEPGDRVLNFVPALKVLTPTEVKGATEKIRKLPGSEGVVLKRAVSPYRLAPTSQDWVKYHNNTLLYAVVLDSKRTKGGVWTYTYGVRPGKETALNVLEIRGQKYTPVGESFATSEKFGIGEPILIESETVNKEIHPDGVLLTAWVPRVIGTHDKEIDTLDSVTSRAKDELVLQVKKIMPDGETEYLFPNVLKELRVQVPVTGPDNATLAFVGASPGRIEAARREPLVGPGGEVFNKVYLEPLNIDRSRVLLLNAVPNLLLNEKERARDPNDEEIAEWSGWLESQLDEKTPKKIIALGRVAEKALAGRADLVLPHPSAVLRFGDSGEVSRKLKRFKSQLVEKENGGEGGTRSTTAADFWKNHWHEVFPKSGKGRFVYQHHWRGLDEEETKLSDEDLLKTDHSLHGDLRLEGEDNLWGFTIFLGETKGNRTEHGDKLIDWKKDDNIEVSPKLEQPNEWLEVGEKRPYVSEPGKVGATSEKYSKFFKIDGGTYELGMAREHGIEIFLDGGKLKGKYLLLYAPISGRRLWLIEKPEDETPFAESRDLADLISELKKKNQRYLIWSKPGERPQKIDVRTGRVEKEAVRIAKADAAKQIIYGVVLDPYGDKGPSPDAHNDWMPPAEIEKTAHDFLANSRTINLQHQGKANAQVVESWVEAYPNPNEYKKALRGESHKVNRREFGTDKLHSGAWVLGVKLGDKEWQMFLDKKINAFSPGGMGVRSPMGKEQMPKIEFVDLVTQ